MGVDRKAISCSYKNGIFIDAGTAITIDIVDNSVYQGGFILLGLTKYIESYKNISSALTLLKLDYISNKKTLPLSTEDAINYGIIKSIKLTVEDILLKYPNKQLYITGGDGKFISSMFQNSIFDKFLILKGVKNLLVKS